MNLNDFSKYHKINLKSKLDFIDLHRKKGVSIATIAKTHNVSQSNIRYWLSIENKLRREHEIENEIKYLQNTINAPQDIIKCDIIINRVENISTIHKKMKIKLSDKIASLDLLHKLQSPCAVARQTGYTKQLIYQWMKNEIYLRDAYKKDECKRVTNNNNSMICDDINERITLQTVSDNNDFTNCKNSEIEARKVKMQMKMNVLDMFDKGADVYEIAKLLNLKPVTVFYWSSNSIKLRTKAAEFDRHLESGKPPKLEWTAKYKESKRMEKLNKQIEKEKSECHSVSLETRISSVKFHNLMGMCSFDVLGEIFNHNRHTLRNWRSTINESLSKYRLKQLWRQQRLDKLLTDTDHLLEIRKLYKLYKSDSSLNVLDSFITYGITFKCRQFTVRKYNVSHRQDKIKKVLRPYIQRKNDLIALSISSDLHLLFETLYRDEYQVLYTINERFLLLLDQAQVSEESRYPIIQEEIAALQSHLLNSFEKLISLHHMMIVP